MSRLINQLEKRTQPFRHRFGGDIFLTGHARTIDRLVSGVYFTLDAVTWKDLPREPGYLDAFNAGLDHLAEPQRVVDVGTGTGASALLLARRWPAAKVEAVDLSRTLLKRARKTNPAPNLIYRRASITSLPYADGYFDTVTALNAVVEVGELRRVCRPGGQVLMVTSFYGLRDEQSDWSRRWAATGFVRTAAGEVEKGSWELFRVPGAD